MPDMHQPDDHDRRQAEQLAERVSGESPDAVDELRRRAAAQGVEGVESLSRTQLLEALDTGDGKSSGSHAGDRPLPGDRPPT